MATKKKRRRNRHDPDRAVKATQRDEARRREREERLAAAATAERRKKIKDRIRSLLVPALVGIGVIVVAYLVFGPSDEIAGVEAPPLIEATELAAGEAFAYDTATPTSGPYAPGDPVCGVFTEPVALEDAVAALRIGAVVLWYQPGDADTAAALTTIAGDFDSHVIVSPNDGLTDVVVATSWGRLLRFDTPGTAVETFAQVYLERGPADGDCPIG